MILMSLLGSAHAFCGTFVAAEGNLTNGASEIALARYEGRTTLTMANDFRGDATEFAMLVPVPVVLDEEDVNVVSPEVFERLRGFSQPREVTYTCDELYPEPVREPMGCSANKSGFDADSAVPFAEAGVLDSGSVTVEKEFIVGEYEIVVLSAEESGDLLIWLDNNGYSVSSDAAEMLQDYLDEGSYFFAAKVFTDRIPSGQDSLSPLQIGYDSDTIGLPIRLGTVNSDGSQDLVLYGITSLEDGRLGISNYDEATVEADCLMDSDSLGTFYAERYDEALEGEARWVVEHGWALTMSGVKCDPCTEIPGIPQEDVYTLGFGDSGDQDTGWWGFQDHYFTRIHMRYTPEQATQDLALYASGVTDNTQQRYIRYERYLEAEFPICGEGWVEDNPGSCADEGREYKSRMEDTPNPNSGCAVHGGAQGAFATLLLLSGVLLRRRV